MSRHIIRVQRTTSNEAFSVDLGLQPRRRRAALDAFGAGGRRGLVERGMKQVKEKVFLSSRWRASSLALVALAASSLQQESLQHRGWIRRMTN